MLTQCKMKVIRMVKPISPPLTNPALLQIWLHGHVAWAVSWVLCLVHRAAVDFLKFLIILNAGSCFFILH